MKIPATFLMFALAAMAACAQSAKPDFLHDLKPYTPERQVQGAMRRAYRDVLSGGGLELSEGVEVAVGHYATRFDFAVKNGSVLQLAHTWSFEVSEKELDEHVKAWAWTVKALRGHKDAFSRSIQAVVPSDVDIEVVFAPPQDEKSKVFQMAIDAFAELDVKAVDLAKADEVANRAKDLATARH